MCKKLLIIYLHICLYLSIYLTLTNYLSIYLGEAEQDPAVSDLRNCGVHRALHVRGHDHPPLLPPQEGARGHGEQVPRHKHRHIQRSPGAYQSIYLSLSLSSSQGTRRASLYFACLSIVQSCQLYKHIKTCKGRFICNLMVFVLSWTSIHRTNTIRNISYLIYPSI